MRWYACVCTLIWACTSLDTVVAQESSRNIHAVGQLAINGGVQALVLDPDPEQSRAFVLSGTGELLGVDLSDPARPAASYTVSAPFARDVALFEYEGISCLVSAGAEIAVYDVTNGQRAEQVARVSSPDSLNRIFAYQHSNGQALLWATGSHSAFAFGLADLLSGRAGTVLALEPPEHSGTGVGFSDLFAGFEPESQQDRLYLAGAGGYYIFNVSDLSSPDLITSISSAAVQRGRAIAPTPNGSHVLALASYRTAPMRIFALSGERVRTAVGAWTDNWQSALADVVVRWPFAFVAALEDGVHVVNIFDPEAPYTDAWLRTVPASEIAAAPLFREPRGAARIQVRNHDGLIAVGDLDRGLWLLRLEAFSGWHGHNWGLPHVSEEQDWTNGPDGK